MYKNVHLTMYIFDFQCILQLYIEKLNLDDNEIETIEHLTIQMENERKLDRSAAIADMRFSYIEKICKNSVKKPHESKEKIRSEKLDRILTGKYTAIPIFIMIMAMVFYLTFNVVSAAASSDSSTWKSSKSVLTASSP